MSTSNGVIRIGRKGLKKFAFGEDGAPFEVDVVVAFQQWIGIDDGFRPEQEDADGLRPIATADMPAYHHAAVEFVSGLARETRTPPGQPIPPVPVITTAEALDFIARLREQYDELAVFFRPKSRQERVLPDTSEVQSELRFSVEEENSPTSTN